MTVSFFPAFPESEPQIDSEDTVVNTGLQWNQKMKMKSSKITQVFRGAP
jgi:hypothetical protein